MVKSEEFQVRETPVKNVFMREGKRLSPPATWCFVPSGDPGLTRRLKAAGEYWVVVRPRKNRLEACGLWCPSESAATIRANLEIERSDPAYQRKLDSARRTRAVKQQNYEKEFYQAVLQFLAFAPRWQALAETFAAAVTAHAVPVGSGTVARTERIPLERRAEAAVIAWMRHQTTAYDHMTIARIKGERREVRRRLAVRSRELLARYRAGDDNAMQECPLARALAYQEKITPKT